MSNTGSEQPREATAIERYYRFHSYIYDATRWSFLFGRTAILKPIAAANPEPARILEVGCGTGKNLFNLCQRFPNAAVTGLDLSEAMLDLARAKVAPFGDRVRLLRQRYDAPLSTDGGGFDLILFSYALSMFNPGFEAAIETAHADLAPEGLCAVVDFHDTGFPWFERWMGVNHVRMNGQLRPLLQARFKAETDDVRSAYAGVWRYLMFVGRKS